VAGVVTPEERFQVIGSRFEVTRTSNLES